MKKISKPIISIIVFSLAWFANGVAHATDCLNPAAFTEWFGINAIDDLSGVQRVLGTDKSCITKDGEVIINMGPCMGGFDNCGQTIGQITISKSAFYLKNNSDDKTAFHKLSFSASFIWRHGIYLGMSIEKFQDIFKGRVLCRHRDQYYFKRTKNGTAILPDINKLNFKLVDVKINDSEFAPKPELKKELTWLNYSFEAKVLQAPPSPSDEYDAVGLDFVSYFDKQGLCEFDLVETIDD